MNLGYSLLLREYITATEVDYGDCQQFQITCPVCHEAIFKAGKYGHDRQYFSHYAASKSDPKQCELRVLAITKEAIQEKNILGRGQSMDQFFAQFRGFIMRWLYGSRAPEMQRRVNWMAARPGFIRYARGIGRLAASVRDNPIDRDPWQNALATEFRELRSAFWMLRQSNFSTDFIDHLLAPNSASALTFAVGVAVLLCPINLKFQRLMMEAKDKVLVRTLDTLSADNQEEFHGYSNLLLRALYIMLMSVPYVDILEGNTNNKKDRDLLLELTIDFCNELRDPDDYTPFVPIDYD